MPTLFRYLAVKYSLGVQPNDSSVSKCCSFTNTRSQIFTQWVLTLVSMSNFPSQVSPMGFRRASFSLSGFREAVRVAVVGVTGAFLVVVAKEAFFALPAAWVLAVVAA